MLRNRPLQMGNARESVVRKMGRRWIYGMMAIFAGLSSCEKTRATDAPKAIPVPVGGALELVAVSFNIRNENEGDTDQRAWHERIVETVKMVRRMSPDVLGVQEMKHGQAADLRASLPDYEFFGIGREDGKKEGEYAGIFYRADRFQIDFSDSGTFWLSATPEIPGSKTWGNDLPRAATWLRLTDRSTGRGFYVFNTHWDHRHQGSREKAAMLMAERIDQRKQPGEPVVLLGDFNAVEKNPAVAYLGGKSVELAGANRLWKTGLIDTYQKIHASEKNRRTLHLWRGSREGGLKVDHILVSKGAKVVAATIVADREPFASDHFPVSARVIFP
jgi:endonuclease/exonuclease/phosphatase family metal-dependent hydrolase